MKLANSHGGYAGRTLINRIERQLDKQRIKMGKLISLEILESTIASADLNLYNRERGRYEGLSAALAILRGTKVSEEIKRSNERLRIE